MEFVDTGNGIIIKDCIVADRNMEYGNLLDIYSTSHVCNKVNGAQGRAETN